MPTGATAQATGRVPHVVFYTQQQELGSSMEESFAIPKGKHFVIEYINISMQDTYKDRYIKVMLTTDCGSVSGVRFKFTFDPILQNNFPYGLYRISEPVKITAQSSIRVQLEIVNAEAPDDGIGDLLISLCGYLTDSY